MSRWQKPENALRRANDLLNVGKKEHALASLQDFINFSKNRVWSKCFEQIMHKYLELCVDLRKPHTAKDGLFQYRRMCQQNNVKSLEEVVIAFLEMGEKKAANAKAESQGVVEEIEDLDQAESPEQLLLSAVSGEGAQDRADRSILSPWLRFLWESYRQCLELLRNNVQVELLYHRVARLAFQFCLRYQRRAEFRKLSDNLRTHLTQLQKHQQSHFNVKLTNPETIALHQETRLVQLDIAIQLESWQEAIKSTDDVQQLFAISGRLPKGPSLASYYDKLALIFWKAKDSLYHAAALLKLFQLCKENRKNWLEKMGDEAQRLATRVLLAVMSIRAVEPPNTLSRHLDLEDSKADHQRRLASLLRLSGPPTKRTLCKEMIRMGVNTCALPAAQTLYDVFETNNNPLTLAALVQNHLKEIEETEKAEYVQYMEALQEVIAIKILKQLSQVYKSITLDKLYAVIPFFDENKLEMDIAYAGWKNVVQVRINYWKRSLEFGVEEAFSLASEADAVVEGGSMLDVAVMRPTQCHQIRGCVQKLHDCLRTAVQTTCPDWGRDIRTAINELWGLQRFHAVDDHEAILERRRRIEAYKEENEKMQLKLEETAREKERHEAEAQRLAEQNRLEQENTERLQAMKRKEQEELQKRIIRDRLERMKDPKFKRLLAEIPEEEMENLDNEALLQKQISHMEQEKREHLAKLRVAEKKWDHVVRALRIEEIPRLLDAYREQSTVAPLFWLEHEKERVAKAIADRKLFLATHERLKIMDADAADYIDSLKDLTRSRFEEKMAQWEAKMKEARRTRLEARKVARKEGRRQQWLDDKAEAERQKQEEERRRREEEEKALRQAKGGATRPPPIGELQDRRSFGRDVDDFVGNWERKGPVRMDYARSEEVTTFTETWSKGRRLQGDPVAPNLDARGTMMTGMYRTMGSRQINSDMETWTSGGGGRMLDGRRGDGGDPTMEHYRIRQQQSHQEICDVDFSRARYSEKTLTTDETTENSRGGRRPPASNEYRRFNDDVSLSRSSFGKRIEKTTPTVGGQEQRAPTSGAYRPPMSRMVDSSLTTSGGGGRPTVRADDNLTWKRRTKEPNEKTVKGVGRKPEQNVEEEEEEGWSRVQRR